MAASVEEISSWFDWGVANKMSHMIIVCDTFNWEDYPEFASSTADAHAAYQRIYAINGLRVMEVYNLNLDKAAQLSSQRAFNF